MALCVLDENDDIIRAISHIKLSFFRADNGHALSFACADRPSGRSGIESSEVDSVG